MNDGKDDTHVKSAHVIRFLLLLSSLSWSWPYNHRRVLQSSIHHQHHRQYQLSHRDDDHYYYDAV